MRKIQYAGFARVVAAWVVLGVMNALAAQRAHGAASIADLVDRVGPSVVYIEGEGGMGSGVVVRTSPNIDILTNYHVMEGSTTFTVGFFLRKAGQKDPEQVMISNARPYFAFARLDFGYIRLDGRDPKVAALARKIKALPLGDSSKVRVGEQVIAIGSPSGGLAVMGNSVSSGIISGKNRHIKGLPYFQTTAPVNPGNSGGPLLNLRGEIIGVVTAKSQVAENMAFALPAHLTQQKHYEFYLPERYSDKVKGLLAAGDALRDRKRYQEAYRSYRQAQLAVPTMAGPVIREANCLALEGKADRAIQGYSKAMGMKAIRYDDLMACVLGVGKIHGRRGAHDKAIAAFKQGLVRDPAHPAVNRNIGVAYAQTGNRSKALRHFMISLWMKPNQPRLRAMIKKMLGR